MFLLRLVKALRANKVKFAITGGYAVALHGAVRTTLDVDIVISCTQESYQAAEAAMRSMGLVSRIPVRADELFNFREEFIKNRNVKAWGFVHPDRPSEIVDVVITHNLDSLKITKVDVQGVEVPILDKQSLITMKEDAGRPQDLEDISALKRLP
jgi:hypothetical protein